MEFEEITLISNNAFHRYLIEGKLFLKSNERNQMHLIECEIKELIHLTDELDIIKINGIEFECSYISIQDNKILGELISINSFGYTKAIESL